MIEKILQNFNESDTNINNNIEFSNNIFNNCYFVILSNNFFLFFVKIKYILHYKMVNYNAFKIYME